MPYLTEDVLLQMVKDLNMLSQTNQRRLTLKRNQSVVMRSLKCQFNVSGDFRGALMEGELRAS